MNSQQKNYDCEIKWRFRHVEAISSTYHQVAVLLIRTSYSSAHVRIREGRVHRVLGQLHKYRVVWAVHAIRPEARYCSAAWFYVVSLRTCNRLRHAVNSSFCSVRVCVFVPLASLSAEVQVL